MLWARVRVGRARAVRGEPARERGPAATPRRPSCGSRPSARSSGRASCRSSSAATSTCVPPRDPQPFAELERALRPARADRAGRDRPPARARSRAGRARRAGWRPRRASCRARTACAFASPTTRSSPRRSAWHSARPAREPLEGARWRTVQSSTKSGGTRTKAPAKKTTARAKAAPKASSTRAKTAAKPAARSAAKTAAKTSREVLAGEVDCEQVPGCEVDRPQVLHRGEAFGGEVVHREVDRRASRLPRSPPRVAARPRRSRRQPRSPRRPRSRSRRRRAARRRRPAGRPGAAVRRQRSRRGSRRTRPPRRPVTRASRRRPSPSCATRCART